MQPHISASKSYYRWIDLLKALSIFGVVYIHTSLGLFDSLSLLPITNYFRFCVPVFITVSFFLLERRFASDTNKLNISIERFISSRLSRLIIPYVFWTCVYIIINHKPNYPSIIKFITNHWIGFGFSGQYYFVVLIILTLVYPWLRQAKLSCSSLFMITILAEFSYIPVTYFPMFCENQNCLEIPFLYLFYMFFGTFIGRNYEEIKTVLHSTKLHSLQVKAILLFTSPILISIEEELLGNWDSSGRKVYFRLSTLLVTCLVVMASIGLEDFLERSKSIKICISFLSSWSLGIFCLNPLLIDILYKLDLRIATQELNYLLETLISFILSSLVVLISVLISFFISYFGGKALVR
ncbi:acyltransferase [Phormidium sp. CLA17]|uniref:acyltransferase n=1 Tax=Leptolyngbya sp. Cla-17 TaxID=2803751 RepID=UPI0014930988|nr:acyltransferase [Leptolyngbya sp. Cla-17]MBM0741364.1 acyltransferase [Leptolyngbya sp. Cla-17]